MVFGHWCLCLMIRLIGVHKYRVCVILVEERIDWLWQVLILSIPHLLPVLAKEYEHEDGKEQPSAKQTPSCDYDSITGKIIGRFDPTVTAVSTRTKAITATEHDVVAHALEGIGRSEVPTACLFADSIATRKGIDDGQDDTYGYADNAAPEQQAKDLRPIHHLLRSGIGRLHVITKLLDQ